MKKHTFKPEYYAPSSEEHRKSVETQRNYHRNNAYLEKHGELDISSEQEPSDEQKLLDADPDFAKFLDSLTDENRAF